MVSIEELVKQSKFKSEKQKSLVSILYINNLINNHFDEIFKKFNLTLQQYNTLRILRGQYPNPCTINLIRERMLDKMSDVSRIVERMRKAELVERVVSTRDRRAVDVIITKKGLNLLAAIDKKDNELNRPFDKLSDKEAAILNTLLQKILDALV